jgi:hypothetical protein
MNLFSSRLSVLPHLAVHELVPGSQRARYALDSEGRRWVYHHFEDPGPLIGLALAQLLGRWLHAPVPEGAVYVGPGGPGWASRWSAGLRWAPILRDRLGHPAQVGAMLALDALLLHARSARDLLVVPTASEARLAVLALGWGDARLADLQGTELPAVQQHPRGLPLQALREGAMAAAGVAERLDEAMLQEFVAESCAVARSPEATSLGAALHARCLQASALVARHLDALESL